MDFEQNMEIFENILPVLTDLTALFKAHFGGPQGTLHALAIAGVFVILLVFVVARRQGQATQRSATSVSEPVVLNELANKAELNCGPISAKPVGSEEPDALAAVVAKKDAKDLSSPFNEEKSGTNVGGFVFHRRKVKNASNSSQIVEADPEVALAAIEQEMLATRQLYLDGVISRDVYVAETRNLYAKAQQKM